MSKASQNNEPVINEAARRILNLLFVFNSSSTPLTTSQIISDPDLGYGTGSLEADTMKFRRDRKTLQDYGIVIRQANELGSNKNEEGLWEIDREASFSSLRSLYPGDLDVLREALDRALQGPAGPWTHLIRMVSMRICAHESQINTLEDSHDSAIWSAFALCRALPFYYEDARGIQTKRTVCIYGIASQEGASYFVGLDDRSGEIRSFRCDRVIRTFLPTHTYEIPPYFNAADYLYLPFDFSPQAAVTSTFTWPVSTTQSQIEAITKGRGNLVRSEKSWCWIIDVKSLPAAASFCIRHASSGMKPLNPPELCSCYAQTLTKAVAAHER